MGRRAMRFVGVIIAAVLVLTPIARAQQTYGPPAPGSSAASTPSSAPAGLPMELVNPMGLNPLTVLEQATRLIPGATSDGGRTSGLSPALNIMLLLTVITLAPSILLMTTSFVRILIVLGLLRQAMGAQSIPPAQVITSLALFMTLMVMAPTIDRIWDEAVVPYREGQIRDHDELWNRAKQPMRDFMFDQIEATGNWSSLYMVLNYRGRLDTSDPGALTRSDVEMIELVPAYMLSELKVAFLMGFRVYLPFLVIDMVIASLLISMSMMMLPPVLISLPFKLLLFVLVDGWQLIVGSLMTSFVRDGDGARLSDHAAPGSAALLGVDPIPMVEGAMRALGA